MYPAHQEKLKKVLEVAVRLSPKKQDVYIAQVCEGDKEMLRQIKFLLHKKTPRIQYSKTKYQRGAIEQKALIYLLMGLILVFVASVLVVLAVWHFSNGTTTKDSTSQTPVTNQQKAETPKKSINFNYGFDLVRAKSKASDGETIVRTSDKHNFHNEDKFRVRFTSKSNGFLYLLNEGDVFSPIGYYAVKENEEILTDWLFLDDKTGVENFWFVFSENKIQEIEIYRSEEIIPKTETAVIRNFIAQHIAMNLSENEDEKKENIVVSATGNIIAYKAALWHK